MDLGHFFGSIAISIVLFFGLFFFVGKRELVVVIVVIVALLAFLGVGVSALSDVGGSSGHGERVSERVREWGCW